MRLVAAGFVVLRFISFTIPYYDGITGDCGTSPVPFGDQAMSVNVWMSPDSLAPPASWKLIASWGARHLVGGASYRILADWPDTVTVPQYRCVSVVDTSYNEGCRSNIVRVR